MRRRLFPWLLTALALPSGACTSTDSLGLASALRRGDVRTIVLEPFCTVFSPYDPVRTVPYVEHVERNLAAVGELFALDLEEPLIVLLELEEPKPVQAEGESLGRLVPTRHGVRGAYGVLDGGTPSILLFVPRDVTVELEGGSSVPLRVDVDPESTLRHEITHMFADLADVDGPTWFNEGLALEVESMRLEDGRLEPVARPPLVEAARRLDRLPLAELLAWEESGSAVMNGDEEAFEAGRPLAHAFLRYLLEGAPGRSLIERARVVQEMGEAELLAREAGWHRWLGSSVRRTPPWDARPSVP